MPSSDDHDSESDVFGEIGPENLNIQRASMIAPHPFDNPAADVILRSSDGMEFHVFSWILRDASPVFTNILSIPQPHNGGGTPTSQSSLAAPPSPVVELSEGRTTLEPLLRLCYPFPQAPTFTASGFDDAKPLLEAAHKYELAFAASMLERAIAPCIEGHPVKVYAFAARFRLTGIMEAAARASLALVFPPPYSKELEDISAGVYHRLISYRENCKVALGTLSKTHCAARDCKWTWRVCTTCVLHISTDHVLTGACHKCGEAAWFTRFWDDVTARLKERPSERILRDLALCDAPSLKKALECAKCRGVMYEQIRHFLWLLAGEAERKIAEVHLEIK